MSRRLLMVVGAVLLLWPVTAHAHLVNTGLGPLYDGVSHLFLSPDDLLGVLAMALLAGLGGRRYGRVVLFAMPLAWFAGGLVGLQASAEISLPVVNTLSFLVVGALVAADQKLPLGLVVAIAAGVGLLHGFLNGTAVAQTGGGALALVGIAASVFVMVALVAAFVVSLRPVWMRIAIRVAGSWIAAIGLLMLGWTFRNVG